MKTFINEDFLLTNDYARELYYESAEKRGMNPYKGRMLTMLIFAFFPLAALFAQPSRLDGHEGSCSSV